MLFYPTEMHVKLMERRQQRAERRALGHLGEGVHVLGEALAAVAVLAIGTRHVGVRVVDIAREQHARVHLAPVGTHHLAPVGTHLLAVLAAGVEISHLISTKHIVHVLGELGLQGGHHGELLAHEDLGKQLVCPGEHHGLLLEVLDEGALGEELRHITHLVARLAREHLAGARQDGGADKHGHIGEVTDQLRSNQSLRAPPTKPQPMIPTLIMIYLIDNL